MVNFPNVLLDHVRCSQCCCALSVGPVRCGPDGVPLCGRCPASPSDVPNPPLQALLARYEFPCRYAAKGCEQFLQFGDVRHEQECQFQDAVSFAEVFEAIDPLAMDDFKCGDCNKLLSVGPLKLNSAGNSVCGRCVDRWAQLYAEEILVRNWKMEFLMQKMPLQCSYYNAGCKNALKWGEVVQHEECCPYRPSDCPATPRCICQEVLPAANLLQHFQREHPTLVLESPTFQETLTQDSNTHRILKLEERLYLVMTKIDLTKNRLSLGVSFIGDVDVAKHLLFTLKIFNPEETSHCLSITRPVESDLMFSINEASSVVLQIDVLEGFLRQPNLQYVMCNITVSQEGSPTIKPMLKICKWEDCKQIGEEGNMTRHEDSCQEREVECKWPRCDYKMSHRLLSSHEDICDQRIFICRIKNCNKEISHRELINHESLCDHRIISCKWTNCKQELPANQMGSHEAKCSERKICRFEDCSIECSGKDWDRHVTQCEHQYEEEYPCCISGCAERLPPPALARHVLSSHPANIVEGATVIRTYKMAGWYDFVYLQYDGHLFSGYCGFVSDGEVVFDLRLFHGLEFEAEYKCAIKVFHPSDPHQTITRDEECHTYIRISADVLSPFVENERIKLEWTIIKK